MSQTKHRAFLTAAFAAAILVATPAISHADVNPDYESWNQIFLEGKVPRVLGGHLRLSLDLQSRRMNTPNGYDPQTHLTTDMRPNTVLLIRPAIGYAVNTWATFWVGYAWQPDFFDAASQRATKNIEEHRIWEQFSGSWNFGRLNLGVRSRLEQRFRSDGQGARNNVPSDPESSNNNTGGHSPWAHRFRQQVRIAYTFRPNKPWQLIFSDEIFFHLNDTNYVTRTGLDQNRAFLGIGYQTGKSARVEVGYMNQYVHRYALPGKYDPNQINHILAINVNFRFGFESPAPAAPATAPAPATVPEAPLVLAPAPVAATVEPPASVLAPVAPDATLPPTESGAALGAPR